VFQRSNRSRTPSSRKARTRCFERLTATLGARYTAERKTIDQNFLRSSENPATPGLVLPGFPVAFHAARTDSAFTPKAGLDYQLTDAALAYVSATKGFKSGGFNFTALTPQSAGFAPETLWSYETGLKTEWLDHRLRVNATAFYYDYTNLQVQTAHICGHGDHRQRSDGPREGSGTRDRQ